MLEARLRELDRETARRPEDPGAWLALAQAARRAQRLPSRAAAQRLGLPRLLEMLRQGGAHRELVRFLPHLLRLRVVWGKGLAPGRFWRTSGRLVEHEDYYADAETQLPLHYQRPADGAVMVLVPEADAWVGPPEARRRVRLGPFLVDRLMITRERMTRYFAATTPDGAPHPWVEAGAAARVGPRAPATGLRLADIRRYLLWAGVAPPTPDAYEVAARGFEGATYPWGEDTPRPHLANFDPITLRPPSRWTPRRPRSPARQADCLAPVGSYPGGESPLGLLDATGAALELCRDSGGAAHGSLDGFLAKGGGWLSHADELAPSRQERLEAPESPGLQVGFRGYRPLAW